MRAFPGLPALVAVGVIALGVAPLGIAEAQTPTTVVLVRHAEKAPAPADDPPLSEAGRIRAEALRGALADWPIDVVLVTPTTRTRQTAAPIAAARGLVPVEVSNAGTLADRIEGIARLVRESYAGKRVLIIGHSNTIPAIVGALGGPRMPSFCDPTEYANLLVLEIPPEGPPRLIRGLYGAADAPKPAECTSTMK